MKRLIVPALVAGASLLIFWASGAPLERSGANAYWLALAMVVVGLVASIPYEE